MTLTSLSEGFTNLPTLYGSKIRKRKEVKDFTSGMEEGAKDLLFGLYDGITGLALEPYEGAKKDGWKGALKGVGRGCLNFYMRPAAGAIALVASPINGAVLDVQHKYGRFKFMRQQQKLNAKVRLAEGEQAVRESTEKERSIVLQAYEKFSREEAMKERRDKWVWLTERAFEEEMEDGEEDGGDSDTDTLSGSQTPAKKANSGEFESRNSSQATLSPSPSGEVYTRKHYATSSAPSIASPSSGAGSSSHSIVPGPPPHAYASSSSLAHYPPPPIHTSSSSLAHYPPPSVHSSSASIASSRQPLRAGPSSRW